MLVEGTRPVECEQVCACYSGQTEPERAGPLLGSSAEGKTWKAAGKVSISSLVCEEKLQTLSCTITLGFNSQMK